MDFETAKTEALKRHNLPSELRDALVGTTPQEIEAQAANIAEIINRHSDPQSDHEMAQRIYQRMMGGTGIAFDPQMHKSKGGGAY